MKHAKKMILVTTDTNTTANTKKISSFEKEINNIFENRSLNLNDRLELYKKAVDKFDSDYLINNSLEDEMENDQNKNNENYYKLFDPANYSQEGSNNTTNNGPRNDENSGTPNTSENLAVSQPSYRSRTHTEKVKLPLKRINENSDIDAEERIDDNKYERINESGVFESDVYNNDNTMEYLNDEYTSDDNIEPMEYIEHSLKRKSNNTHVTPVNKKSRYDIVAKRYNDSTADDIHFKKRKIQHDYNMSKRKLEFDESAENEISNRHKKKVDHKNATFKQEVINDEFANSYKNDDNTSKRILKRPINDANNHSDADFNQKRLKENHSQRVLKRKADESNDDYDIQAHRMKLEEIMRNNKRVGTPIYNDIPVKKIRVEPIQSEDVSNFKWTKYRMSNIQ